MSFGDIRVRRHLGDGLVVLPSGYLGLLPLEGDESVLRGDAFVKQFTTYSPDVEELYSLSLA